MSDDWYRNKTWNPDLERRFEERLRRAKKKDQYLRIQALHLVQTHPAVALQLIDRFFALDNPFWPADGFDVKAKALESLGLLDEAIASYESALAAEAVRPSVKTNAFADLSELVVTYGMTGYFDRVLAVLDQHQDRLVFPILRFIYHACRTVIFQHKNRLADAKVEAAAALQEAALRTSGLQYHPDVGIVSASHASLLKLLHGFRDA